MPRAVVLGDNDHETSIVVCFHLMHGFETMGKRLPDCFGTLNVKDNVYLLEAVREPSSLVVVKLSYDDAEFEEAMKEHYRQGYPILLSSKAVFRLNDSLWENARRMVEDLSDIVPVRVRDNLVIYRDCSSLFLALREYSRVLEKSGLLATTPSKEYLNKIGKWLD